MVEKINNNYYLRMDKQIFNNILGGKAQLAYVFCANQKGIVTCGSRHSIQVLTFALMCQELSIPCHVHIPKGKDTEMTDKLKETNCIINIEKVGYNNVLNAHARDNAKLLNYKYIPLGMKTQEAFDIISENIACIKPYLKDIKRIVVPVGSGTTLIGVIQGLIKNNINIDVLGVMVGMDSTKFINESVQYENLQLVKSSFEYEKAYKETKVDGIELNSYYEAKCLEFLQENDLLYIVAK